MSEEEKKLLEELFSIALEIKKELSHYRQNTDRVMQHIGLIPAPETKKRSDPMERIGAKSRNNQASP